MQYLFLGQRLFEWFSSVSIGLNETCLVLLSFLDPKTASRRSLIEANVKIKLIDVVLVGCIVAAFGVLAWRIGSGPKPSAETGAAGEQIAPVNPQVNSSSNLDLNLRKAKWQPINDEIINELRRSGIQSLEESKVCAQGREAIRTISIERLDVKEAIELKKINVHLGDPRSRCYRVGDQLRILLFDRLNSAAPFVQAMGSVKVSSIFEVPVAKIPNLLFQSLGISRDEYSRFFGDADPATLVLFHDYSAAGTGEKVARLPVFPRADNLTKREFELMRAKLSDAAVLDLRSDKEMAETPIAGASAFSIAASGKESGVASMTRKEIEDVNLDVNKLIRSINHGSDSAKLDRVVFVVSSSSTDWRAAATLLSLTKLGIRQLYWYPVSN